MSANKKFNFEVLHQSKKSRARVGKIQTAHGDILTPNFIAVGTNGSVKAISSSDIEQVALPIIFCNTYHLMLSPGADIIAQAGGIHNFANLGCPVITDSGGFQVFSLKYGGVTQEIKSQGKKNNSGSVLKITEDGVLFRSYRDGEKILLTPETSIAAQKKIGADIIVAFDELLPYHADKKYQRKSLDRTHRWEVRSLAAHKKDAQGQALYAVIHGGIDEEMRAISADFLSSQDFDGFGIGGSVGKNLEEMLQMLQFVMPRLDASKPNHLLGIADFKSIFPSVELGVDTFDSSYPTKAARHGLLLRHGKNLRIDQAGTKNCFEPVDASCTCYCCKHYTVAYLCHLYKAHELLFYRLATIHNLNFMINYFAELREKIIGGEI